MHKPQLSSVRINYYYHSGRHFKTSTSNIRIYLPYCFDKVILNHREKHPNEQEVHKVELSEIPQLFFFFEANATVKKYKVILFYYLLNVE